MIIPQPHTNDLGHWAAPWITELAETIDALSDAAFETLAIVHQPAVCRVMAAYRPGATPMITSCIVGADAWRETVELANDLGVIVPD